MRLARCAVLAALLVLAPHARAATTDAVVRGPLAARIDRYMTAAAELGCAGSLLVEKDGAVILHKGYGTVNRATGAVARAETPYLLGSLSKQFTAAAIYKLAAEGRLSLADTLGRWLPGVPPDKRAITLDQLVHHTSGMVYLAGGIFDSMSTDSMVRAVLALPLDAAPGDHYAYSNPGYNLLAVVVARAAGTSFDDFLRRALFEPSGMSHTGFADEPAAWPPALRTPSYSTANPDPPLYPGPPEPYATGAGTIVSTCGDLWKWEQSLRAHRVLDAAWTARLFAPGPSSGPSTHYAAGWQVAQSQRNTTVIMHAGDIGGFNTDMRRFVDEHATIVFLSNARQGGRGFREVVLPAVTRLLFGPELEMPPPHKGAAAWRSARTQADMSLLAGSDSTQQALEARANAWAKHVAAWLLAGNRDSLEGRFHPSIPAEEHAEFYAGWRAVADTVGGAPRVSVLGTVANSPVSARTYVELAGARGTRVLSLDWVREKLIGSEPVPDGGYRVRFWSESPTTLARYDLWSGRVVRVPKGAGRAG